MTVSLTTWNSGAQGPTVVARAEAIVAAACDHLERPQPGSPAELRHQLDELGAHLEQRVRRTADPEDLAECSDLLISVLAVRCELLDHESSESLRRLSDIRSALDPLRGLPPQELIDATPTALSRALGFERAMISTVRGSMWMPGRLHIENPSADPYSRRFVEYVAGRHVPLAEAPLEAEVIRKRCGVVVKAPMRDKRTFKEIVEVSGSRGYVAAPVVSHGRAIGMLHADRPGSDGGVTADHLERLEAFAECLALVFESAVLEQRAALQRLEVENINANVDELIDKIVRAASHDDTIPLGSSRNAEHCCPTAQLTAREREIMASVATGATNRQIARNLMISEGTVKTHLKHIARKLNTSSRTAAIAVFSGLTSGQP